VPLGYILSPAKTTPPFSGRLQLFDLPLGLVVDDKGRATADRLVKSHQSVGNRSRDTLIFPRTARQVVVFVVDDREYVVTIVGFNAATVELKYLSHHAQVIESANRHVVERAFSFDIAGDSSLVNDGPRAASNVDFCHNIIYIVRVVFRLSSLRKLRR
jgi:hypothetical protein